MRTGPYHLAAGILVTVSPLPGLATPVHAPGRLLYAQGACLAAAIAVYAALFRERRKRFAREQQGRCLHCGYDLTGNASGVCPECGTPVGRVR